jgi:hypothetical protein
VNNAYFQYDLSHPRINPELVATLFGLPGSYVSEVAFTCGSGQPINGKCVTPSDTQ